CSAGTYQPLTEEVVARVHDPAQIAAAKQVAAAGGGFLEADTILSADSFQVALAAAGARVAAGAAGPAGAGAPPPRPRPGRRRPQATQAHGLRSCLFNHLALPARHARDAYSLTRVLIVDWDVHHGNGTQDIFYASPEIQFLSIHRYGHGFYPGTGAADETGTGPGLGHTINVPVRFGTSRREYHDHFLRGLEKAAERIKPELVLVSAGFDAHRLDPIGSLGLEVEDFPRLTRQVLDLAKAHPGGPPVRFPEGGYHPAAP